MHRLHNHKVSNTFRKGQEPNILLLQVMLKTEMSLFCTALYHESHMTFHLVTHWSIKKTQAKHLSTF